VERADRRLLIFVAVFVATEAVAALLQPAIAMALAPVFLVAFGFLVMPYLRRAPRVPSPPARGP